MSHVQQQEEQEFSFKHLFSPLTTLKAIHVIVILGLIVYFGILFNGIAWDDETFIFYYPQIQHFNLINLIGPNLFNSAPYYRPIPAVYFSLLYTIFSNVTFFYHAFQLILHLTDTSLLFLLLTKFFKKPIALLLSLIFLIHPINVESVAYISATQSELFLLFGISALLLSFQDSLPTRRNVIIHSLLLLALLTKEVSLVFLLMMYVYRLLYKKQITRNLVISSAATIIIYGIIRFSVIGISAGSYQNSPISELPFLSRLITIPSILFYYIKGFLFPITFAIDQIWTITTVTWTTFSFPLIIDVLFYAALLGFGYYCFKIKKNSIKPFVFFFIWYIAGMSLLLQIFPLDMTVADRWFYFPMIGLLGIIGLLLENISLKKNNAFIAIFFSLILLFLSYKTIMRVGDWHDALTLYNHDLQVYDSPIIEEAYAIDLGEAGQYSASVLHFKKSIDYKERESSLANLANTYQNMGNTSQAIVYYEKALQVGIIENGIKKHYEDTYINFIKALVRLHQLNKAKIVVVDGINQFPKSSLLWSLKTQLEQINGDNNAASNDLLQLNNLKK